MKYRKFGKTGVEVSALGFGCMRLPQNEAGTIDRPRAIAMIRHAIDSGVNYVDTAYMYHGGESEVALGEALRDGYREKVFVADKMPLSALKKPEDFDRIFEEQLARLGLDSVDFYLMHAANRSLLPMLREFRVVEKMEALKKAGKVRFLGFSFHDDFDAFRTIVDMLGPEWDFCQIQYNYEDIDHQAGQSGLEYAAARGFGVVVMEPLLGGRLANPPERVRELMPAEKTPVEFALDYVWNQPHVSLLLSGMSSEQQVEDNLTYASRSAIGMLSDAELEPYTAVKQRIDTTPLVPCTKCRYCMPCPFGVDIPGVFACYNANFSAQFGGARKQYAQLEGKADLCQRCGRCEKVCPQQIAIRENLAKADKLLR